MSNLKPQEWFKFIYNTSNLTDMESIFLEYKVGLTVLLSILCALCSLYFSISDFFVCNSFGLLLTISFFLVVAVLKFRGWWEFCGFSVCIFWMLDNILVSVCSTEYALALTFYHSLIPSYLLLASNNFKLSVVVAILAFTLTLPFEYMNVYTLLESVPEEELRPTMREIFKQTELLNKGHLVATFCLTGWMYVCNNHETNLMKILLEQSDSAKRATEAFFFAFSHEFRNPLNTLLGSLELLSDDILPELTSSTKTMLRTALDCGELLGTLINNVLDVSKIEVEMFTPAESDTHSRMLFHKILRIAQAQALKKGLKIELSIDQTLPKNLFIDATRFTEILMNLVSNSIKFTEEGYVKVAVKWHPDKESIPEAFKNAPPQIEYNENEHESNYVCIMPFDDTESEDSFIFDWEISECREWVLYLCNGRHVKDMYSQTQETRMTTSFVKKDDRDCLTLSEAEILSEYHHENSGVIEVSVEDSGIGISEEAKKKLFNPFEEADSTISKNYGGTGLGLWISKMIVEFYKGNISIESEEGKGSTFTVKLPCQVHPETIIVSPSTYANHLLGIRCIVIDMKSAIAKQNSYLLRELGVETREVTELSEFMEELQSSKPFDIIFVSMGLEGRTGVQLIAQIKEIFKQTLTKKPIFLLVPDNMRERVSSATLDFQGYLSYPLKRAEVLRTLKPFSRKEMEIVEKKKVLLIEDNDFAAMIAGKILEKEEIPYEYAADGKSALNIFYKNSASISMVLLDTQLPDMTGYEIARYMREFERNEKVGEHPIISLSGETGKEHEAKCFDNGMTAILTKPVKREKLISIIQTYLY